MIFTAPSSRCTAAAAVAAAYVYLHARIVYTRRDCGKRSIVCNRSKDQRPVGNVVPFFYALYVTARARITRVRKIIQNERYDHIFHRQHFTWLFKFIFCVQLFKVKPNKSKTDTHVRLWNFVKYDLKSNVWLCYGRVDRRITSGVGIGHHRETLQR